MSEKIECRHTKLSIPLEFNVLWMTHSRCHSEKKTPTKPTRPLFLSSLAEWAPQFSGSGWQSICRKYMWKYYCGVFALKVNIQKVSLTNIEEKWRCVFADGSGTKTMALLKKSERRNICVAVLLMVVVGNNCELSSFGNTLLFAVKKIGFLLCHFQKFMSLWKYWVSFPRMWVRLIQMPRWKKKNANETYSSVILWAALQNELLNSLAVAGKASAGNTCENIIACLNALKVNIQKRVTH